MSGAMLRSAVLVAVLGALGIATGCGREARPPVTGPGLVALIVLDTVRADHLSLCGYSRPTSPRLDALVQKGASWTCDAYTPETWTLPTHASFFTGVSVPEHGADYSASGQKLSWGARVRPLDERLPTLAELMARSGYRSIAVSGNPVISKETGLARGFHTLVRADQFGELYGKQLIEALDAALAREAADAPLFLFLNVADAHHPWAPIPGDLGWLPARPGLRYEVSSPDSPWRRYMAGELGADEARELISHNTDLYDYGIHRADATLAAALELLERRGRMSRGHRIVITSDHGEFLGQHGLTGHCCYAYEAVTRVPFVALSSGPVPQLPRPLAALWAHHWLRDGRLPAGDVPVSAVGYPSANLAEHVSGRFGHQLSVALWHRNEKLHWIDGRLSRYEIDRDPREENPLDAEDHPLRAQLEGLVDLARRASDGAPAPGGEEAQRHLEALGYVD
jgi:hypothetical protein